MSRLRLSGLALAVLLLGGMTAPTLGGGPGPGLGAVTHLPVPRFVSLRSDQVNFRAGPGFQYPVVWVYQRAGLPVEVVGEFDVWRQVIAPDGGSGWVHEATIRARRAFFVTQAQAVLRAGADAQSTPVAYVDQGVSGLLLRCDADAAFCKVTAGGETGYLARTDFWGAFPAETVK